MNASNSVAKSARFFDGKALGLLSGTLDRFKGITVTDIDRVEPEKFQSTLENSLKLLATEQRLKALHSDGGLSEEQRREKAQEIRQAGGAAIKAELTPEQATQFEAEVRKQHRDGPPGGGPGGKGGAEGRGPKEK